MNIMVLFADMKSNILKKNLTKKSAVRKGGGRGDQEEKIRTRKKTTGAEKKIKEVAITRSYALHNRAQRLRLFKQFKRCQAGIYR